MKAKATKTKAKNSVSGLNRSPRKKKEKAPEIAWSADASPAVPAKSARHFSNLELAAFRFLYATLGNGNIQGDGSDDGEGTGGIEYGPIYRAAESLAYALGLDPGDLEDYVKTYGSNCWSSDEVAACLHGPELPGGNS